MAFINARSDNNLLKAIILCVLNYSRLEKCISNTNNMQCMCITEFNVQQLGGLLDDTVNAF